MPAEPIQPLSPEEQTQLAELQYREAMTAWSEGEDARLAKLAAIEPVANALGDLAAIDQTIGDLETAADNLDDDAANRTRRVAQILRYDACALLELHEQLQTPQPEPVAPATE
jgi:hypothetical protein